MLKKRRLWFLAIALGAVILYTLLAAPGNNQLNSGSTYNRAPDGYGAWYAFMEKQGIPIKRWQKPFDDLPGVSHLNLESENSNSLAERRDPPHGVVQPKQRTALAKSHPSVLLRINPQLEELGLPHKEWQWVEDGNTLVILGVRQPVTEAAFSTHQKSPEGVVKIDTQRREKELRGSKVSRLGDRFGSVVWEEKLGKGRVIYATTPYLAANAYQDESGNYKFLAELVTRSGAGEKLAAKIRPTIWVDEYIHGYKDPEVRKKQGEGSWVTYLAKTPLAIVFVQVGVILLVLVLAGNRRFGLPATLATPVVDHSEAYIQALASVLHKAESSEFVVEVLGKEEQLHLQKSLSLGTTPVDHQTISNAWVQQTGRSAAELEQVLQLQSQGGRISEKDLLSWLGKWQTLYNHLRV